MAGDESNGQHNPNNAGHIRGVVSRILDGALKQYTELALAVCLLTVLPLPVSRRLVGAEAATARLGLGSGYFPLVGLLLALILGGLAVVLHPLVPRLALAALLVVALMLLTGGLHLDGLMDACDGLFGSFTRERRLEIMRDSRVGSFAVLGGVCALMLRFAFFASVQGRLLVPMLLIALPTSRWAMVLAMRVFPSARSTGLGAAFRRVVTWGRLMLAGVTALVVALVAGGLVGLVAWAGTTMMALALGAWITRRLGGLTGDTYGAIEEVTEVVALLLVVILGGRF